MQSNKKSGQLVGLFLSSILAIGLVGIPTALAQDEPDYTNLTDATAEENNGKMKLTVTTDGDIPRKSDDFIGSEDVPVFGYAWLDDNNNGVVAAIHPDFDDSAQNPSSWHTHPVTIASDNCIEEIGTSQGGISIKGNTLTLQISKQSAGDFEPGTGASFIVQVDDGCEPPEGADVGLRVTVLSHVSISP